MYCIISIPRVVRTRAKVLELWILRIPSQFNSGIGSEWLQTLAQDRAERMTSEDGKAWGFLSLVVGALPWVDSAWRLPPMRRQAKDDYILYKGRGCKDQMFRTLGHAKCRDPVCGSSILGPAHRWTALFWECSSCGVRGISDHQRVTICCYLAKLSMIDLSSCWVPRFLLLSSLGRVTFEHLRSSAEPNPSRSDIFIEPCRHGSRLFPPNSWYLSTAKGSNIWSMNRRQKQVWFCFWH